MKQVNYVGTLQEIWPTQPEKGDRSHNS